MTIPFDKESLFGVRYVGYVELSKPDYELLYRETQESLRDARDEVEHWRGYSNKLEGAVRARDADVAAVVHQRNEIKGPYEAAVKENAELRQYAPMPGETRAATPSLRAEIEHLRKENLEIRQIQDREREERLRLRKAVTTLRAYLDLVGKQLALVDWDRMLERETSDYLHDKRRVAEVAVHTSIVRLEELSAELKKARGW